MSQTLEEVKAFLSTPQNIIITMHRDPDADAMGSSLGWAEYLTLQGHDVTVISPTDFPSNLKWMHGIEQVLVFDNIADQSICKIKIESSSLICCLDFSVLSRIKDLGKIVQNASANKLMIDHHLEPDHFSKWEFWDTKAAATAQLVYHLIKDLQPDLPLNKCFSKSMAACLYAGIMTDTGSFQHSNVTAEVHRVAADLIEIGIDANRIKTLIYDNAPLSRLQFLGYILSKKLTVLTEYRTAYMVLTEAELIKFNSSNGDTEGIVNYGLQIENVVMSCLFIERRGEIKISFRSAGSFSVRDLASAHFSGGGHKNASGGKSDTSINKTIQHFLSILPEYKEALLKVD